MITDSQLDSMLRSVLREDADAAVGSINVTDRVRARMLHTSTARFRPSRRATVVIGLSAAALALSVGGAAAISSDTSFIRLHRVPAPYSGVGTPVDMTMAKPYETTIAEAETVLGFHVQTLDGFLAAKTPVKSPDGRIQSVVFTRPSRR
jgi:hypothetical protein